MASHINISSKKFYEFLKVIGLTPRKSLTLSSLKIPENYFRDFLRGVNDGDGCIYSWTHKSNGHLQWSLRFISGSPAFINWLRDKTESKFQVRGRIHSTLRKGRTNPIYFVKFGKMAAKIILQECYYSGALVLKRKEKIVQACLQDKDLFKTYGNVIARVL